MRKTTTLAAFLLLVLAAGPAAAAGITPAQLLDVQQVRHAALSPDGRLAAYTVTRNRDLDEPAGGAWSELWVVASGGGEARPFVTGEVTVGAPAFSPDGGFVGFTLKRGEDARTQVWVIPVDGGEARPATASPTGVKTWAWSGDGAHVLYVDATERPAAWREREEKGWLPTYHEEDLPDRALRRVPFAWGGPAPEEPETLVDDVAVWSLDVGADGRHVAFGASPTTLIDQRYMFQDIRLLDLETGEHTLAVDVPGKLGAFRLSPDGRRLAWTAAASRSDHAVSSLYVRDLDGAEARPLTPPGFAGHIREMAWRDDRTLLYRADEGVTATLALQDVEAGPDARKVVFRGAEHDLVVGMPATRPGKQTMVMVGHNATTPRELYAWAGGGRPKRLTRHNPWLDDVALGEQRVIRWTARDGLELEGVLMLPVDGKLPAPLVVDVHGGPESHEVNGWLSRYASPGQALCARGYAVFFPNYRGSTGRGVEFAALAFGDPAGPEFDDIVDGVEHLLDTDVAARGKVGVMGGSYGGYATNWLCTRHSEHFQAGVSFVGVSDLVSKRLLTDIPYEDEYVHMGAPVRETWDLMRERSPIAYADRSRTPLLILHGDSDPRVHPSQSQELHRALRMAGHPAVRLVYYPGEGHGNRARFGRADFLHRTMDWFDHYLREGNAWDGPMPPLDIGVEMGLPAGD